MKTLNTLVTDVYDLLEKGIVLEEADTKEVVDNFKKLLTERLAPKTTQGVLRMSNLGSPDRQLWLAVNKPEKREKIDGQTLLKFLYGDLVELLLLFLVKKAGHTVTHEQHEVDINGVKGHPDGIIDGVLTDVKSASGYGMNKFERHSLEKDDPFFYLDQLFGYLEALKDEPDLRVKSEAAFLAVDKSSGKIVIDSYKKTSDSKDIQALVKQKQAIVSGPEPKELCYPLEPDGSSGNMKLPLPCSYCGFKKECYPDLRVFLYSGGPRYLAKVVREPKDVPEVKVK